MTRIPRGHDVDILILGAGWTSTFLIPLLEKEKVSYAATSTTGREGTSKFKFEYDPENGAPKGNEKQYAALPVAKTILITFPLKGPKQSAHLVKTYRETHGDDSLSSTSDSSGSKNKYQFIQLGSTGIYTLPGQPLWQDRNSNYNKEDVRAIAEDELLDLGGCVLNLSGLWGGERQVRHWIDRVAPSKEVLRGKTSLHMIHGEDVARGILGVHRNWNKVGGQRWMLTDLLVYDWWALILGYAGPEADNQTNESAGKQIKWVGELMAESDTKALPRSMKELGRAYDAREFWKMVKLMPVRARI